MCAKSHFKSVSTSQPRYINPFPAYHFRSTHLQKKSLKRGYSTLYLFSLRIASIFSKIPNERQSSRFFQLFRLLPVQGRFFAAEGRKGSLIQMIPDILHQLIIEIQIVQHTKAHGKHLFRLKQMADIRPGIMAAGWTSAFLVDRTVILRVFCIVQVDDVHPSHTFYSADGSRPDGCTGLHAWHFWRA